MALAFGACTKTETTTTANTQAPTTAGKTESTKSETKDTKSETKDTKATGSTKRSTGTTSKSGKGGTPKASDIETTPEEQQCFEDKFTEAVVSDPDLATKMDDSDATAAGVIGGLLVSCMSKAKIADGLVSLIKQETSLSESETSCVRDELISLDTEQLATLVGVVIFSMQQGSSAALAPITSAINDKCDTKIPA